MFGVPRPPRPRACCAKYCGRSQLPALGPASGLSPPAHSELGSPEESAWSESRIADFGLGGFQKTNWTASMPAVRVFRVQTRRISASASASASSPIAFLLLASLLLLLPLPDLRFCSLPVLRPFFCCLQLSAASFFVSRSLLVPFLSAPNRTRSCLVTLSSTRSGAPASHVAITSKNPQAEGKGPKQRAGRFSAKFRLVDQPTSTIDSFLLGPSFVARSSPASFE
ncbi:hypothetical protein GGI42DRAFT_64875 [Trichoderma sp. SZMC 28013]